MANPIEFWFDYSSPYSHIAAHRIEAIAAKHGRTVDWKPMMIGFIFKNLSTLPLVEYPLKGEYSKRDFARSARLAGVPWNMPATFPIATVNTARATLWIKQHAPAHLAAFIRAALAAYFVDGKPINDIAVIGALASSVGLDGEAVCNGLSEPAIKDGVRALTDEAYARGVFGAPFMFVDGEPFWGNDRLEQVDRWLETGGF